jgi:hypothetical protein
MKRPTRKSTSKVKKLSIGDVEKLAIRLGNVIRAGTNEKKMTSLVAELSGLGDSGVESLLELLRQNKSVNDVTISLYCMGETVVKPLIRAMPDQFWESKDAAFIYVALQSISKKHPLSPADVKEIAGKATMATLEDLKKLFNLQDKRTFSEDEVNTIVEAVVAKTAMSSGGLLEYDAFKDIMTKIGLRICLGRSEG